jgi:UDP-N-acetylmuramate-alanine ligase
VTRADKQTVADELAVQAADGTLVLTLGAGDVYKCGERLVDKLRQATR